MATLHVPRPLPRPPAVTHVLRLVSAAARRHSMFQPGDQVVVAVSGGRDSVALLHAMVRLRRLFRISVTCFHFDHRLREGSDRDARWVRRLAREIGVPFVHREAQSGPGRGDSLEAWARTVRYRALSEVLDALGGVAAVAHTADDQAETVLLALLRGGGLESLGGMAPVTRRIVRPLLDVTREETGAFCRSLGVRPREDPMNEDPAFMRAALRHRAIPALERALGRGVRGPITRTSHLLRQDAELLDELSRRAEANVVDPEESAARGEGVALRSAPLGELPAALGSRIVRRALLAAGQLPEAAQVQAVLDLATGRPGRRVALPGGLLGLREGGYVRLFHPSPPTGSRRSGDARSSRRGRGA